MNRYPILTPFKHQGVIHKAGWITLDDATAKPYREAGVIGPAIAQPADSTPSAPQQLAGDGASLDGSAQAANAEPTEPLPPAAPEVQPEPQPKPAEQPPKDAKRPGSSRR